MKAWGRGINLKRIRRLNVKNKEEKIYGYLVYRNIFVTFIPGGGVGDRGHVYETAEKT